ncbi:MAG: alpha/beta hydrolase-fold protein [Acidobacteriota bacterium]
MRKRIISLPLLGILLVANLSWVVSHPFRHFAFSPFQDTRAPERRRTDRMPLEIPGGARVEFGEFYSAALKEEREYSIFLPQSYSSSQSRYPVVYFLHGLNNDHTSWTVDRYGRLHEKLARLIADKKIPEVLMVHPKGDNSFYTNYLDGSKNYEDYITQDLIQFVEKTYRVKSGTRWRAIGGTSMGGFGALKIAFKHKNLYSATAGHSPIVFQVDPSRMPEETKTSGRFDFFTRLITPIFGNPVDIERWRQNNPLDLARNSNLKGLRIYFDYGTADRYNQVMNLGQALRTLDQVLAQHGEPHIFREYPNEPHGWELVSLHLPESMAFLCESFW